jgi:hypothetical protein
MIQTKAVKRLLTYSGTHLDPGDAPSHVNNARDSLKRERYFGPELLL